MTLTIHAVSSIVISRYFPAPVAAFTVSFFLHYLMDIIPHGDEFLYFRYVKNKKDRLPLTVAAIDVTAMVALFFVFSWADPTLSLTTIAAAAFGGIMPDLLINLHTLARHRFRSSYQGLSGKIEQLYHQALQAHHRWHMFWHFLTKKTTRFRYGIGLQIILIIVLYWLHAYYL